MLGNNDLRWVPRVEHLLHRRMLGLFWRTMLFAAATDGVGRESVLGGKEDVLAVERDEFTLVPSFAACTRSTPRFDDFRWLCNPGKLRSDQT